ncbi:hypothetical protein MRS44_000220 [Fusarium solani]|uniref:uncharacterized protein n=1 Tax=Fusarium solani TaxID=169388 RepID=UPI002327FB09|nr:hypothetical protein MRS44_000220 [Fusarium solani]KAJ4203793.1 hypothetical protein NW759_015109 [Fusarium solani]
MVRLPLFGLTAQTVLQASQKSFQPSSQSNSVLRHELDASFCPAGVRSHAGSIEISDNKELFYWLFESASEPANDPLIVWLSGGPGAASTFAAISEVGPCWVNTTDNSTFHNPYHWARNANLLILDQPAGAGFSLASLEERHQVVTLEQATEDFVEFMHLFIHQEFPGLSKNELHIAAESYGGRWAPAFMHQLLDLAEVQSPLGVPNPLGSIILVNAVVGTMGGDLSTSNYEFGCTPSGAMTKLGYGFNASICSLIQERGPTCEYYGSLCETTGKVAVCKDASNFCAREIADEIPLGDRNMYNIAQPCENPEELCINAWASSVNFFNDPAVQSALGVRGRDWTPVNTDIAYAFMESGAFGQSVILKLSALLDSGKVRVLVLNGHLDALTLTPGQIRVFDKVPWRGQVDYRQQEWREWTLANPIHGVSRGAVKNSTNLKFITFENAGHMVPGDDPAAASWHLTEWLHG